MKYAIKYPDFVDKLILCSCTPLSMDHFNQMSMNMGARMNFDQERFEEINIGMMNGNVEIISDYFNTSVLAQFVDKVKAKRYVIKMNDEKNDLLRFSIINRILMKEYIDELQSDFKFGMTKSLVLHGRYDAIPLESSKQISEKIENSVFEIIEDCGHYPFLEKSKEVFINIQAFIKGSS